MDLGLRFAHELVGYLAESSKWKMKEEKVPQPNRIHLGQFVRMCTMGEQESKRGWNRLGVGIEFRVSKCPVITMGKICGGGPDAHHAKGEHCEHCWMHGACRGCDRM